MRNRILLRSFLAFAFSILVVVAAASAAHAYNSPYEPYPWDGAHYQDVTTSISFLVQSPYGSYDLYWGTDPTPPLRVANVPITGTHMVYPVGMHTYGTTYYWRVVVSDNNGTETSGPTWTYRTHLLHEPPYVPVMESPSNGSIKLPTNMTLDYSLDDFDGPVVNADVYLGTDQNPPLAGSHVSPDKYTPPLLQPNTAYFWRVVARDETGLVTSSATWMFATANTTNQSPTAPSHYWYDQLDTSTPTLFWDDATDPDGEALTFDVYFAAGTDAKHPLQLIGSTTGHSIQVAPLTQHRRYYWRVRVRDSVWTASGPEQWFDYGTVPVLFSRFAAHQAGANVDVSWVLQSDEAMDTYTLYRREGETALVPIASAPVSGVEGSYVDTAIEAGKTYRYELLIRTTDGDEFRSQIATVSTAALGLTLHQNVPNPFNPLTTIRYDLPAAAQVRLQIVDVSGRRVRTLVDENQNAGSRQAIWNGRDDGGKGVASGVYFYVLEAGKQRLTRKLVLLK